MDYEIIYEREVIFLNCFLESDFKIIDKLLKMDFCMMCLNRNEKKEVLCKLFYFELVKLKYDKDFK